ncbi:anti-repressor SinI family protein [Fictibacillus phosphorivorans]|uniref:anti-repressor SinI family protein n=1 Tax=Fictibacillus phosphorivorans TaxID=1221500 RepID=UPI000AC579CE|nr:anti-repressor SinI family protein [Fictibacillus phosphorivorans]
MEKILKSNTGTLDAEWIKLVLEAKYLGVSIEEIQKFLKKEGVICFNNCNL